MVYLIDLIIYGIKFEKLCCWVCLLKRIKFLKNASKRKIKDKVLL